MKGSFIITSIIFFAMAVFVFLFAIFGYKTWVLDNQIKDMQELEATFNAERLALAINTLCSSDEDVLIKAYLPKKDCKIKFDNYEIEFTISGGTSKVRLFNKISTPITISCNSFVEKEIKIEKIGDIIKVS